MFPIVQMISCKVCKINMGYDVRKSPIFPAESFLADFTVDIEFRACFQRHLRNSDLDSGNMPVEPENICCRIVPRRWTTVFRIVPPPQAGAILQNPVVSSGFPSAMPQESVSAILREEFRCELNLREPCSPSPGAPEPTAKIL